MMKWRDAVLSSLHAYCQRRGTRIVQRQLFIAEELDSIIAATGSVGATPQQSLSKNLQQLRDEQLLEFLGPGEYLLLDSPIDVEKEELTDEAIDHALRANRLRLGVVPTDSQDALVRQRRGQARIHTLTVEQYGQTCAVCDVTDRQLLIASHIVGWAESPENRGDLSNVICLCRMHDALFETGYWSLNDELVILKKQRVNSTTIQLLLQRMDLFRLPSAHPPAQAFVRRHRERWSFGT
jgi:hypothetical protein